MRARHKGLVTGAGPPVTIEWRVRTAASKRERDAGTDGASCEMEQQARANWMSVERTGVVELVPYASNGMIKPPNKSAES
jgi:hypothetical protein